MKKIIISFIILSILNLANVKDYIQWRNDMLEEYGITEYIKMNKELNIDNEFESYIDYILNIK